MEGWKWEEDNTWGQQRQKWIEQYNKLGKTPSHESNDINEKQAGQWQANQRYDYKNNEKSMTLERIKILEETPGWKWNDIDIWETHRQNWIKYHNKENILSDINKYDIKQIQKWQSHQRYNYKKKYLSNERIKILNETPGWKWSNK